MIPHTKSSSDKIVKQESKGRGKVANCVRDKDHFHSFMLAIGLWWRSRVTRCSRINVDAVALVRIGLEYLERMRAKIYRLVDQSPCVSRPFINKLLHKNPL